MCVCVCVCVCVCIRVQLLRVWDVNTCERVMKLKGHTDNVRSVKLNRDGTLVSEDVGS